MSEETQFLEYLNTAQSQPHTSLAFSQSTSLPHATVIGLIKKLEVRNMINTEMHSMRDVSCSEEGEGYVRLGRSAERMVLEVVAEAGETGLAKKDLVKSLQSKYSIDDKLAKTIDKGGFGEAKKRKWIDINKGALVAKVNVNDVQDDTYALLNQIAQSNIEQLSDEDASRLKKRKLIEVKTVKYFVVTKGEDFALELKDTGATDLTHEALRSGKWKEQTFKPYNFAAKGKPTDGGYMHPLLKVRSEFRKIFLELGFQEMTTNRFVESSFWNFDALFQPQQHPARDAHDTFFTSEPKNCLSIPEEYMERVKKVHEEGGYGSVGYRYDWSLDVSKTNLLRTHTTAVSSRILYDVAQKYKETGVFTPHKFFSIDRVFRNETTDETHLCEFHQVEGMVIDRGLSLGDMIGLFSQFFAKIGITDLRFKPAYNPYTEPSMEIFGFHPQLGKWTEIGNSGMFRPEMLEPMGLPSDVVVLAWGLSLERPTMILYGINHIQHLMGHTVEVSMTRDYPICQLDKKKE